MLEQGFMKMADDVLHIIDNWKTGLDEALRGKKPALLTHNFLHNSTRQSKKTRRDCDESQLALQESKTRKPNDSKSGLGLVTNSKSKDTQNNDRLEVRSRWTMTDSKSEVMEGERPWHQINTQNDQTTKVTGLLKSIAESAMDSSWDRKAEEWGRKEGTSGNVTTYRKCRSAIKFYCEKASISIASGTQTRVHGNG